MTHLIPALRSTLLAAALVLFAQLSTGTVQAATAPLTLKPGDKIALVGNALGERMQHHNHFEALLHASFADHKLVVRNLCQAADEVKLRPRTSRFGEPDKYLAQTKTDVIFYFLGFNESFAGPAGLEAFKTDLTELVKHNLSQQYNGNSAPRIVLISPIAQEDSRPSDVKNVAKNNANIQLYTTAIQSVAQATGVGFVDLYTPSVQLYKNASSPLTLNTIHLSDAGYKALSPVLLKGLFPKITHVLVNQPLLAAIADKNFHWFNRYRIVNDFSIFGQRRMAGGDGKNNNESVMLREIAILDQLTANRDQYLWQIAAGKKPGKIDDSNTLPFIEIRSNADPRLRGARAPRTSKRFDLEKGSYIYKAPAEAIKEFVLPEGYQVNLFASEQDFPELANPVSMTFDNRGRLWVTVMPSYPQWKPKSKLDDKILILEDTDGDGKADKSTVFAGGLHVPTAIEIGHGGVYVATQPDILFLTDTDGDGKADHQERALTGFSVADTHHGIAAMEWGPDGALYFGEGTFKFSQVESPYGPQRVGEAGVWRYHPRSKKVEPYITMAFANPWGIAFDRYGETFIGDASPGKNFFATLFSGYLPYPLKHPGGNLDRKIKHPEMFAGTEKRGVPAPMIFQQRIRPSCGIEILSSSHFPDSVQGNYLVNNVINLRGTMSHYMKAQDSGYVGTEDRKLTIASNDPNYRPVALETAPDGSLFILDWHNALIGHLQHNLREPHRDHKHGRVWRVTYKGRDLVKSPALADLSVLELLNLLTSDENQLRYRVRRELTTRDNVAAAVTKWLGALDSSHKNFELHQLEALWTLQQLNRTNVDLLKTLIGAKDARIRAAAIRVACDWRDDIPNAFDLIAPLANDKHPRVRLEVVRVCSFFPTAKSMEVALSVLAHPMDTGLQYALDETLRSLEITTAN